MKPVHLSLFASGSGSNALKIMEHLRAHPAFSVRFTIFCNNAEAGILEKGRKAGAEVILFSRQEFTNGTVLQWLHERNTQLIVLAGFLWLLPPDFVQDFSGRILNIHPSLLPKYGGKGMYGLRVHEAVLAAGERCSGITIHQVNEHYDQGNIVLQAVCDVAPEDTPESLQRKVQQLEHRYFPLIIGEVLEDLLKES